MLAKARQVDDELREDQRILEELKSFTKKEEEEESKKVLEARAKQLQWLDGVSISFLIFKSKYYLKLKYLSQFDFNFIHNIIILIIGFNTPTSRRSQTKARNGAIVYGRGKENVGKAG